MAKYVSGTEKSTAACWYLQTTSAGTAPSSSAQAFTRFLLSTDDAGMGIDWDTEDVSYACEEAAVTVLNSSKWAKSGVVEKIVTTANARGKAVSDFLNGLFTNAISGDSVTEDYQAYVVYSDLGGSAGDAKACLCTIQINNKTAAAGEKRGFEFDILPVGTPVDVTLTAEAVDSTTNEISVNVTLKTSGT